MMRNNLLNFAEFERKTIAARVADAYSTRARETGFYQGGKTYYGFTSERRTVNGKTGSVLVPSEQAESVKIAYDLYQKPSTSLKDVIEYFKENDIYALSKHNGEVKDNMDRSHISRILESPLYVRADKEVYTFFVSKGYEILDDIEAYDGIHGVFLHDNADGGKYAKVGYHEGLVDASVWLRVKDKKSNNKAFPTNRKVMNSWLAGLIKCKECGYAVLIDRQVKKNGRTYRYLNDNGWLTHQSCVARGYKIKLDLIEEAAYHAMCERMENLEISRKQKQVPDTETKSLKADILRIDSEIHSLMDRMAEADDVVFAYIQQRINELHEQKEALERKMQAKARKRRTVDTAPLEKPMKHWDKLSIPEKHELAAVMLEAVYVSDENGIEVKFSI